MLLESDVLAARAAGLELSLDEFLAVRFPGPDGVLHSDSWCTLLEPQVPAPALVVPRDDPRLAPCSSCDGQALLTHPARGVDEAVAALLVATRFLALGGANRSPHATAARLEGALRIRRDLLEDEVLPEVASLAERVLLDLERLCTTLRTHLLSCEELLLDWVVAEVLSRREDVSAWPPLLRDLVTLQGGGVDRTPFTQLLGLWRRTRSGRSGPGEALRVLSRVQSSRTLHPAGPGPLAAAEGELPVLFALLDAEAYALLALRTPAYLVGFSSRPPDLAALAVLRTYGDDLVLVVPELVGLWAASLPATMGVQALRTTPPPDPVLETVRALFDPRGEGVLSSLADALAAARAVCST